MKKKQWDKEFLKYYLYFRSDKQMNEVKQFIKELLEEERKKGYAQGVLDCDLAHNSNRKLNKNGGEKTS